MFHGRLNEDGIFSILDSGITLPKLAVLGSRRPEGHGGDPFESRQTPTLLGIGLLNAVASEVIVAGQDKEDDDGDGVRGIAHILEDGRLGRFGWKANVPNIAEFVRDAMSAEMGITVPVVDGMVFGVSADDDAISDPEIDEASLGYLAFYIEQLPAPKPKGAAPEGVETFEQIGYAVATFRASRDCG